MPGVRLLQVELRFGDRDRDARGRVPELNVLSPLSLGGTATVLHLIVENADAVWERALAAGAKVREPLADALRGERYGHITDPFGHRWGLAQHLQEVPPEGVQRAATALFGG